MAELHDALVKVGLTAEQYSAFHRGAKGLGLYDSACARMLILKFIRELAITELSAIEDEDVSTKTVLRVGTYKAETREEEGH